MPDEKKFDPFKPQQPVIPGVPAESPKKKKAPPEPVPDSSPRAVQPPPKSPFVWMGVAAGAVLVVAGIAWWAHGSSANSAPPVAVEEPVAEAPPAPKPVEHLPIGPGEIVRTEELTKPWSYKRFIFNNPYNQEKVPAVVVRLPGKDFWAVSLREPYGNCNLEYVTDLEKLSTQYHYSAEHPMVADPCGRVVFDLARYATGPNGLVRGAVVKGTAPRPPIAIEVETNGQWILAVRIENAR